MPLHVAECTTLDYPKFLEVEKAAWVDDPFTKILFPGPFPEEGKGFRIQEMEKQRQEDTSIRWLKVVDTDSNTDEGIAFAQWHIYADHLPGPRKTRSFVTGCNIEACELIFNGMADQRDRLVGDKNLVYLHNLITDPKHQRRGAAGLLLDWGAQEALQRGLPMYVESSPKGHELYRRHGFRDLELREVDLGKWGATQPHRIWAMITSVGDAVPSQEATW